MSDSLTIPHQMEVPSLDLLQVEPFGFLSQRYEQLEEFLLNNQFGNNLNDALVFVLKFMVKNGSKLEMEAEHRNQLNMFFVLFRNLLRRHRQHLPDSINLLLLETIELRASRWTLRESCEEYFHNRRISNNNNPNNCNLLSSSSCMQSSSRAFKPSGLLRATKSYGDVASYTEDFQPFHGMSSFGRNRFRDQVIIKNSDSGKVMGIKGKRVHMIEKMSDTMISLKKVSLNAKDRPVQICGPSQESIEKAKSLIDLTIRQNASPISSNVRIEDLQDEDDLNYRKSQYNIKLNLLDTHVDICVSNPQVGLILEQFIDKYNFENFATFLTQQQQESMNGLKSSLFSSFANQAQSSQYHLIYDQDSSVQSKDSSSSFVSSLDIDSLTFVSTQDDDVGDALVERLF